MRRNRLASASGEAIAAGSSESSQHSEAQESLGLESDDISGDDWAACQAVGHAAWFLHMQGVLVPAAGGVGLVITAYEQRARPDQLTVRQSADLTPAKYKTLR